MEAKIKKLLEFNGPDGNSRNIYFLNADGQYWVALKPIVDALGLNWKAQHRTLKSSKILSLVSTNQWIPDISGVALYNAVRSSHFLSLVLSNQTIPDSRNYLQ